MYLRYCIFSLDLFAILARSKGPGYSTSSPLVYLFASVSEPLDIIGFQKTSLTYHKSTYSRARKSATSLSRMSTRFGLRVEKYMTYSLLICCDCNFPKILANSRFWSRGSWCVRMDGMRLWIFFYDGENRTNYLGLVLISRENLILKFLFWRPDGKVSSAVMHDPSPNFFRRNNFTPHHISATTPKRSITILNAFAFRSSFSQLVVGAIPGIHMVIQQSKAESINK